MARTFQVCTANAASVSLAVELTTNTVDEVTIISTRRPITVRFYDEVLALRRSIAHPANTTQVYDIAAWAIPVLLRTVGSKTMLRTRFAVEF